LNWVSIEVLNWAKPSYSLLKQSNPNSRHKVKRLYCKYIIRIDLIKLNTMPFQKWASFASSSFCANCEWVQSCDALVNLSKSDKIGNSINVFVLLDLIQTIALISWFRMKPSEWSSKSLANMHSSWIMKPRFNLFWVKARQGNRCESKFQFIQLFNLVYFI